uniref:calymmin n=1 Tax=Monopterus albus TaxID=43700 RepID=UPI0009B4575F|nr:fibroin heavy chain-like [Monopterus albus]
MPNYSVSVCVYILGVSANEGGGSGVQEHLQEELVRGGAPQTRVYIRPSQSGSTMLGQLLQSTVILWLVQTAYTGGVGAQNGYGRYPTKGVGYGPAVGVLSANGVKSSGYGAAAGLTNGGRTKSYGAAAGVTNGQGGKPLGYGAQAGGYGGQGTKGYGATAGVLGGYGAKPNGIGAAAGFGTKGNGEGAAAGPSSGKGAIPNGQRGAGSKPIKGYGRLLYGAGLGVGAGASRSLGVPQLTRNQGKAYNSNGYNGYRAQPMGVYNGYGSAGLALGPWYGKGGMKGLKQGYSATGGVPSGQGAKHNGYAGSRGATGNGALPNGYGHPRGGATKPTKPEGYGAIRGGAVRSQPGYGNGAVDNGYGIKPSGYGVRSGAAVGGYGGTLNGYGAVKGLKPQATKGAGAVSPSEGYGGAASVRNGHLTKAANSGYGMGPFNGRALKGGVLSLGQPNIAPEKGAAPQQTLTQGASSVAPELTGSIPVMVPQDKYQKLLSPVPQGKSYKQILIIPQATSKPALLQTLSGPALVVPEGNPTPEPAAAHSQENTGGVSISKEKEPKPAKPDCGPSGVPNGQWMKISPPSYGAGAGVLNRYGAQPSGYGAGGYAVPGLSTGYGAGYGQGLYPAAGNGNSFRGLHQAVPAADGKSGGARHIPYNGAPVVPAGLDVMGSLPTGDQTLGMGAEKSNTNYGIGGFPFGGQPLSAGKYGLAVSPYQLEYLGLGHKGRLIGKCDEIQLM